jgi:2'-5' RNA ligase
MIKTDRSLMALIPPAELYDPIQAIRARHDRNLRWVAPHVTLLFPFVERSALGVILPRLEQASTGIPPFTLRLATFRVFSQRADRFVIWLDPQPADAITELHDALLAAAPSCTEQSDYAGGFTPHLTVGRTTGAADRDRLLLQLGREWIPLTWHVDRVALLYKPKRRPYEVIHELPLG